MTSRPRRDSMSLGEEAPASCGQDAAELAGTIFGYPILGISHPLCNRVRAYAQAVRG